jgi:hypothetical protein
MAANTGIARVIVKSGAELGARLRCEDPVAAAFGARNRSSFLQR